MPVRISVNGIITSAEDARISVLDHGFLYGDNVYETVRTYEGKPFLFSRHYARLQHSAEGIYLQLPQTRNEMLQEIRRTLSAAATAGESRIRVIVTRGVGGLSPAMETCTDPTTVIIVSPLGAPAASVYTEGVAVLISKYKRGMSLSDVKTGNLIPQVLAQREAHAANVHEVILTTPDGYLSDGITSNVYLVRGRRILTPSRDANALAGITRGVVLELAGGMGLEVVEGLFRPDEISAADEMFLTSTTREVVPVVRVNGAAVGNGRPGNITGELLQAYRSAVKRLLNEDEA
jgi:branched-chain amino acid aminotransferase